jgi:hypothetical protein
MHCLCVERRNKGIGHKNIKKHKKHLLPNEKELFVSVRVTRLGEFLLAGRLFALSRF